MELRKFTMTKNTTSATYREDKNRSISLIEKEYKPHPDLVISMEKLRPIFHRLLGDMGKKPAVTGFEYYNDGKELGITISGSIQIPGGFGDTVKTPTPLRRFADVEIFPDSKKCQRELSKIANEVHKFFYEQKYITSDQTNIEDENEQDNGID